MRRWWASFCMWWQVRKSVAVEPSPPESKESHPYVWIPNPVQQKRGGEQHRIRWWESMRILSTWESQTAPAQTNSDFFVTTPAWEIYSDLCLWRRPFKKDQVWLVYPEVNLRSSLFSERTLGRELEEGWTVTCEKRLVLPNSNTWAVTLPPPEEQLSLPLTCCDMRQRGIAWDWKYSPMQLGMMAQRTWTFGLVGIWAEVLPSGGQMRWKIGVPSWAGLILYFYPLLFGVVKRGYQGARQSWGIAMVPSGWGLD